MGNRADDEGTDVEIYRKPFTDTVHADTPTGAPEELLALLDRLGFERKTAVTAGPVYSWHESPPHLTEDEKKRLATRAIPALITAGYEVFLPDYLFDPVVYQQAVHDIRNRQAQPQTPKPAPAASATASPRRNP
ncbi:hypothetical protein CTU88_14285 [Streptomyces sp. JV178]|uniref:hypothetical protein n=1 Tax=Streptomyces sp. JV178 TaxID=858632 RepID=UPI000C1B2B7B|nr:hypothetical protein [Streptomyces sp. JV178]PIM71287.1 hypothetical protein CTU88_14285 [Streptomyces sp. JV178]